MNFPQDGSQKPKYDSKYYKFIPFKHMLNVIAFFRSSMKESQKWNKSSQLQTCLIKDFEINEERRSLLRGEKDFRWMDKAMKMLRIKLVTCTLVLQGCNRFINHHETEISWEEAVEFRVSVPLTLYMTDLFLVSTHSLRFRCTITLQNPPLKTIICQNSLCKTYWSTSPFGI